MSNVLRFLSGGLGREAPGTTVRRADVEELFEDVAAGAKYQQALLPQGAPTLPGYDVAFHWRPARALGGDFFDLLPTGDGRTAFLVADASGKSVPASLVAVMGHLLFRVRPEPAGRPAEVLSQVNALLQPNIKKGTFITALYAVLDPASHRLTAANAGHLPLVVWHSKAKIATTHRARGPVLGVLPPGVYESNLAEEEIQLEPGDRLLMFTDGVNEAMAPGQREFGMEHLRARLKAASDGPSADFVRGLVEQMDLHRAGGAPSDDVTIVTARRLPEPSRPPRASLAH
jgi:sigma-B regulation protein RsbU (phosphoserine phosphatase)